ncbi:MAG: bacteriocin [Planctomycetaceae bacterium]|nr:bacteriocin [Planctomycetaceae bacterium]
MKAIGKKELAQVVGGLGTSVGWSGTRRGNLPPF